MTATIDKLNEMFTQMGSDVTFHREEGGVACPCLTPEGFRDPDWHDTHPEGDANPDLAGPPWNGVNPPPCNEQGYQTVVSQDFVVKAAIQPAQPSTYRRQNQRANDLLGDIQVDDKIGIFPVTWNGNTLDFTDWSEAGEDYILYDGDRYIAIASDKVPDIDGDPNHHWEVGLRLVKATRPTDA